MFWTYFFFSLRSIFCWACPNSLTVRLRRPHSILLQLRLFIESFISQSSWRPLWRHLSVRFISFHEILGVFRRVFSASIFSMKKSLWSIKRVTVTSSFDFMLSMSSILGPKYYWNFGRINRKGESSSIQIWCQFPLYLLFDFRFCCASDSNNIHNILPGW